MPKLVSIAVEREARREAIEAAQIEAFDLYKVLAVKAQKTLSLEDAMAAGKAWGNFIGLFAKL